MYRRKTVLGSIFLKISPHGPKLGIGGRKALASRSGHSVAIRGYLPVRGTADAAAASGRGIFMGLEFEQGAAFAFEDQWSAQSGFWSRSMAGGLAGTVARQETGSMRWVLCWVGAGALDFKRSEPADLRVWPRERAVASLGVAS